MKFYILWHALDFVDESCDYKIVGAYRTKVDAEAAIERAKKLPGFKDFPEHFVISTYTANEDRWTEGFIRLWPGEE